MKKVQASKGVRLFWAVGFVIGLACLGVGVAFYMSGPEMIVPALIFGVPGAFVVVESLGRMLGWEK